MEWLYALLFVALLPFAVYIICHMAAYGTAMGWTKGKYKALHETNQKIKRGEM